MTPTMFGQAVKAARDFEQAMAAVRATLGQDAVDLIAELHRTTQWALPVARASVTACFVRGLTAEQTRDVCRAALQSRIPVGTWLYMIDKSEDPK